MKTITQVSDIPVVTDFKDAVHIDQHMDLPSDWLVYIADVRGSTKAIEAGRYKAVNITGSSCILAAINAAKPNKILFTFGGDGATLVVPPQLEGAVSEALLGVAKLAEEMYQLTLRVGRVPISRLRAAGAPTKVMMLKLGKAEPLAQFSGVGFSLAEAWIKDAAKGPEFCLSPSATTKLPNLDGLECRWSPVKPQHGFCVSVLAQSISALPKERDAFYEALLKQVQPPLTRKQLHLSFSIRGYILEARARHGRGWSGLFYFCFAYGITQLFRFLWLTVLAAHGKKYQDELVNQSDYQKFDGTLRLVSDLDQARLTSLTEFLESHYQRREAIYGVQVSGSAQLTCLIFDRSRGNHLHFVDGSEGGYALAAKGFKHRMKELMDSPRAQSR